MATAPRRGPHTKVMWGVAGVSVEKDTHASEILGVIAVVRAGSESWARDVYGLRMVDRHMRPAPTEDDKPTVERRNPLAYAAQYQRRLSRLTCLLSAGRRGLARVLRGFAGHRTVCAVTKPGLCPGSRGWTVAEQPLTAALSRYVFTRSAVAR
jgi:hypothetical protein